MALGHLPRSHRVLLKLGDGGPASHDASAEPLSSRLWQRPINAVASQTVAQQARLLSERPAPRRGDQLVRDHALGRAAAVTVAGVPTGTVEASAAEAARYDGGRESADAFSITGRTIQQHRSRR
jgi:hypothetical protein